MYLFVGLVPEVTVYGGQDDNIQSESKSGLEICIFDESVQLHIFTNFILVILSHNVFAFLALHLVLMMTSCVTDFCP